MDWPYGQNNLITDVTGVRYGSAQDEALTSGVSVILPDEAAVAACDIRGGAPGTLGGDVMAPENIVEKIDGLFLSGGSAYGLASGSGMADWLGARGVGFTFSGAQGVLPVPVIGGAILFDLNNGGDKNWGETNPYYELAKQACARADKEAFALGNGGAGLGAVAGSVKGGLGSASHITEDGFEIGALVAVNAFGSVIRPDGQLWAADFERGDEMGGLEKKGLSLEARHDVFADSKLYPHHKMNTVIAICATNALVDRAEARRLAVMAQDGISRAVRPAHTIFDGDCVFVMATGKQPLSEIRPLDLTRLGGWMADCLTRAIGRAVWEARSIRNIISYREHFGL